MSNFFVAIYDFFHRRRALLYVLLAGSVVAFAFFAARVSFDENVTSFFSGGKGGGKSLTVFKNLKFQDKILVMISRTDSLLADSAGADITPDDLIEAAEQFTGRLMSEVGDTHIKNITTSINDNTITEVTDYIYNNLPLLLTEADYARLDSLLSTDGAIAGRIEADYNTLTSPIGGAVRDIILRDPLGMGGAMMLELQEMGRGMDYQTYDGYIFSPDMGTLLIMIDPVFDTGSTGPNDAMIEAIERECAAVTEQFPDIEAEYFGGPSIGVYNARQIKQDTMLTSVIALLVIVIFITLAFRNKWTVLLMLLPVAYGALFSLAIIYFLSGSISAIAIGAGSAVFGIAMSYSIHVLSHRNHIADPRRIVAELAYPLTVGSITTIGAFIGLLFTSSKLLQDFGLFAALALIGTTIFSLVFLPHMLRGGSAGSPSRLMRAIEKLCDYPFDRKKWLVGALLVVAVVCFFKSGDVRFDSDMTHLSVEPKHIKDAENRLNDIFNSGESKSVLFVVAHRDADSAAVLNAALGGKLQDLKAAGLVESRVSTDKFIIPAAVQRERIERWNAYWDSAKRQDMIGAVETAAAKKGFREGSFDAFAALLSKEYSPVAAGSDELAHSALFSDWVVVTDSLSMVVTKITLTEENKHDVYAQFMGDSGVTIVDRAFFAEKMAVDIKNDFNLVLYISSLLIFIALLLSYGRIELALMAFLPMALSWVIILGIMALFGIEFNIVNIILSTFIFGIGDDFSIFIMDGMLGGYKTGCRTLATHKVAIFFSAFTVIVGIGVLVFAGHPVLRSISTISILGIIAVVIVSFTIQPVIFRLLISGQTTRGGFPFTLLGMLNSIYCFLLFMLGCGLLQGYMSVLILVPVDRKRKKLMFHAAVSKSVKWFLAACPSVRVILNNKYGERFEKPAVIIANHRSFIDILSLLGLNKKMVMVTNGWVWNSPFFGRIVRYADFYHTADGYENLAAILKEKVADGYSVIIFPEGSRSPDQTIRRFHKGAFYLANTLELDLLPIVLYGHGLVSSKRQPFFIKKGFLVTEILDRIAHGDARYGTGYAEKAKSVRAYFRAEYERVQLQYGTVDNPYFYDALIKNYTYKGPVLEWYMRIKVRLEGKYRLFDELIPRECTVTDIGCGYGALGLMLGLLSDGRRITGVDYDENKIDTANHSFLRNRNVDFVCADASQYDPHPSDVFVMNDVLHYMDSERQRALIEKCIARLNPAGMIIIRDGDNSRVERHKVTVLTEVFSTRILRFNKFEGELCFTLAEQIGEIAAAHSMSLERFDNDRRTSNTIFILRKL